MRYCDRIDVSELKDRGIYMNREGELKQRLERSMRADQLSKSLRSRPYMCVIPGIIQQACFVLFGPRQSVCCRLWSSGDILGTPPRVSYGDINLENPVSYVDVGLRNPISYVWLWVKETQGCIQDAP